MLLTTQHVSDTFILLVDGGKKVPGAIVLSDRNPGGTELYLAGSYEENELMKAEALINTGKIDRQFIIRA